MKLYLLSTNTLGDFYVVAETPNDAEAKLKSLLDAADYGYSNARTVHNIKILSEEIYCFPEKKPNFSSDNKLILPNSCS